MSNTIIDTTINSPIGKTYLVFSSTGNVNLRKKDEFTWQGRLFRDLVAILHFIEDDHWYLGGIWAQRQSLGKARWCLVRPPFWKDQTLSNMLADSVEHWWDTRDGLEIRKRLINREIETIEKFLRFKNNSRKAEESLQRDLEYFKYLLKAVSETLTKLELEDKNSLTIEYLLAEEA